MSNPPKKPARTTINSKIEGSANALAAFIRDQISASEKRIMEAVRPERWTDRMLRWVEKRGNSWAWVAGALGAAFILGAAFQAWVSG